MISYVNAKKEYQTILINILTPLIFQGFQSIYETSRNYKMKNNIKTDELRIFQDLLRNIVPNWSASVLEQEVRRIKIMSKYGDTLDKLLVAIVKANLHIQTMHTDFSNTKYIKNETYENVSFTDFIHKVYIQAAREIFNNPYLFSSCVSTKEIKENQKEVLYLIKESIKISFKDVVPLDKVVSEFLENHQTVNQEISVSLLGDEPNKVITKTQPNEFNTQKVPDEQISKLSKPNQNYNQLQLEYNETKKNPNQEISLLSTVHGNIADKIFSSLNIQEAKPQLVEEMDVRTVTESTFQNKIGHTISAFLKDAPVESEIKQSVVDDFIDVYQND